MTLLQRRRLRWIVLLGTVLLIIEDRSSFVRPDSLFKLYERLSMWKDKCTNRPLATINALAKDNQYGFSTTVSCVGIYCLHLCQVISAWFHNPCGVIVPLSNIESANLTFPSRGEQSSQPSHSSVEPARTSA